MADTDSIGQMIERYHVCQKIKTSRDVDRARFRDGLSPTARICCDKPTHQIWSA